MTASDATDFSVVLVYGLYHVPEIKSRSLSWGHSVFGRKEYLFSGGLSLEAIYQSSGSSFHAFFVKTTKEKLTSLLKPLHTLLKSSSSGNFIVTIGGQCHTFEGCTCKILSLFAFCSDGLLYFSGCENRRQFSLVLQRQKSTPQQQNCVMLL